MPHVVTQSCCADAACVVACPVNCIHPAPGEPGFAEAEMLYVDPKSCVDCGACATACPADAIVPHTTLTDNQLPFLAMNAEYFQVFPHADRSPLALVPEQRRIQCEGEYRIAVVGAGPAGMYTADELLKHPEISVDVYDRLPTPYGLVRAGVAPDHPHTKQVAEMFRKIEKERGFRYFLAVEVGKDVSHAELAEHYHAVIYTVGAAADRSLNVEGEDLVGAESATDFVGWYNGHPDKQRLTFPLDHERAVIVGNGNVALDAARIMTADPEQLARTDIADAALEGLRGSQVREVVVLGRRGPAQAAFTVPELVGLSNITDLNVVVDAGGVEIDESSTGGQVLAELAQREVDAAKRTIVLRFLTSPVRILGDKRVTGVEVVRNRLEPDESGILRAVPTDETEVLETHLVLRSVGYHGRGVPDLPYDAASGTVPNDDGRVRPGVYVAGWVKRGPTGFIGTNKSDAQETVDKVLDDIDGGVLVDPTDDRGHIHKMVRERQPATIDRSGWRAIDREERRRGLDAGRPRIKITDIDEMLEIAGTARTRRRVRFSRRVRSARERAGRAATVSRSELEAAAKAVKLDRAASTLDRAADRAVRAARLDGAAEKAAKVAKREKSKAGGE